MLSLMATTLLLLFSSFLFLLVSSSADSIPVNIGVILDLNSTLGQTCQVSLNMAINDFYAAHPNTTTRLRLHFRNSHGDVVTAASDAIDLISNDGVTAILGPQSSSTASFVVEIGARFHVPIISFSATSPSLLPSKSHYFIRAAVVDSVSAHPIAALVKYYGWRRVIPIYEDSDFGTSFIPSLVDALNAINSQVPYRIPISISASNDHISKELYRLKTMQTRVFVVHATQALAIQIFANAKESGMINEGFAWIATSDVTSSIESLESQSILDSVQGVLGVKPYIAGSEKLNSLKTRWRKKFLTQFPNSDTVYLSNFNIWAYDSVFAVAMAAETSHPTTMKLDMNATNISQLPIVKTGEKFLQSMLMVKFDGVAGKFKLVNRELNVTAFQIVNFGGRNIGFWTLKSGLTRRLSSDRDFGGLGPVIWPGDMKEVPKGFVKPISKDGRLKILVPGWVDTGFRGFISVDRDPVTNVTTTSGYVIEVFQAAVRRLPYALTFEYIAYMNKDGDSLGNYNSMVLRVPSEYDAIVADMTITAERAKHVDFTLPYAMSDVSMLVPYKNIKHSSQAWIFLKPLTAGLWTVSAVFFLFTGLVVWFIEHRVNEEFRGPPLHQIGTVFYFTFSTLVFSHKEGMVNNLTRIVVIVWVFVVFILQSSYTANLSSMLTLKPLEPTVSDIKELINSKESVGYLKESFMSKNLVSMGFDESRLKPYDSPEQYADALSRGTKNGGVAAILDEIPYLKVFLKDYCANYTLAGQPNMTGGFGFAFPKGSPFVPDLSRAILNLTESEEMAEIERRWFGDETSCPEKESPFSSNSFDFMSFWGLFLITGSASMASLFIYTLYFLYTNKQSLNEIITNSNSKSSMWRLSSIAKLYDGRDLSSHTFKKSQGASPSSYVHDVGSMESSHMSTPHLALFGDANPQRL